MSQPEVTSTAQERKTAKWPWWEPYLFTGFVIAGVVVAAMILGFIARIPFMEHILLGLMTLTALFDFFHKTEELPAVAGKLGSSLFFGIVGALYIAEFQYIPGVGYCLMSFIWFLLFLFALGDRRRIRKETLDKLDRVIDSLKKPSSAENEPG